MTRTKRAHKYQLLMVVCLVSASGLVAGVFGLRPSSEVHRIRTDGITSYYAYSSPDARQEGKLPAIISIGHPLVSSPRKSLSNFKKWFDEPVLVIWSGLMSDMRKDSRVDDEILWARKRQQFLTLLADYRRKLPIDNSRIYLTGFSASGVYAWMLAYDQPALYAGVVPMSATSYPRQIQEHLEAAKTLVTVAVRGEKDHASPRDLAAEMRTGKIIESCHPDSRFVLKPGEGHPDMYRYWPENLQYILQFRRNDGRQEVGRIRTNGITSYYVYSGTDASHEGKLPAIIFIGHPLSSPFEDLATYQDRFDEPVLLIWSGLISDLRRDCRTDDQTVWAKKRPLFLTLLDDYEKKFPLDKDRIYLTGFSAAGVYAWMLAYDHPDLYAAVVPMSATCYPHQIQEHLEAAQTLVTVFVCGEKDDTLPQDLAGEIRTGRIIESCKPGSRFVLKPGEGHRDMHKYWRESLQYVLQFRRKDVGKMTSSREHTATWHREAFLSWARRAAVPLPVSPEEPLGERAQAALERMLGGKRFVFLGEPDHCVVEKYPFRLMFIRYLFGRGWRHVGMETGRSVGWRVDRYLATGDTSYLSDLGAEPPSPTGVAVHDKTLEFADAHEEFSHRQLRQIAEGRAPGTPRLHYWGYDLDLGIPLGSVEPIRWLLKGHADSQVHELLNALDRLGGLSTDEQLAQIEAIQNRLTASADIAPDGTLSELQSWLAFLHDSVAAEKRPRANQDPRGSRRWWAQREQFLMQSLDAIVDRLSGDDKLILLGHNVHLSKDATNLHFHPQFGGFWGLWSWLRAWGYRMFFKLAGWPTSMGDSVGAHVHRRFPGQVLSIWMLYGQGSLMAPKGPRTVRLHDDTVESLLAQVGDRFLLPLKDVDPQARAILSHANVRLMEGHYASTDLTAQADALYFVREVNAE